MTKLGSEQFRLGAVIFLQALSLIEYVAMHGGLGSLILTIGGVLSWLAQQYVKALLWDYHRRRRASEVAIGLLSEIEDTLSQYTKIFTTSGYRRTLEKLRNMKNNGKMRPFVVVANDNSFMIEQLKSEISLLPERSVAAVTRYYAADRDFGASYHGLGSKALVSAGYDSMKTAIRETYDDANRAIKNGQLAIEELRRQIRMNKETNRVILLGHFLGMVLLTATIATLLR